MFHKKLGVTWLIQQDYLKLKEQHRILNFAKRWQEKVSLVFISKECHHYRVWSLIAAEHVNAMVPYLGVRFVEEPYNGRIIIDFDSKRIIISRLQAPWSLKYCPTVLRLNAAFDQVSRVALAISLWSLTITEPMDTLNSQVTLYAASMAL